MRHPSPTRRWAGPALALTLTAAGAGGFVVLSAPTAPAATGTSATLNGSLDPLGINTAAWDSNFADSAIATDLSSADTGLVRYPGGSTADQYLWQTNAVSGSTEPLDFAQYSSQVDAISDGQKFVTVDYGSDTAADAAAWVTQSKTAAQNVALWEIGNEEYGSWETDTHSDPHTASSYATNALTYMQAMKAADSNAQICYDYAMDGSLAPGSGVSGWQSWNDTILQADAADIDCADVHWYPVDGTPTETVQSLLATVGNIPAAATEIHTALTTYDPSAYFVVGETNISQTANAWNEEPVGALYAAATDLEWLSYGAQSVDWWDTHNYGTPTADFGMFSSASSGEPSMDTPYPPYYGYELASLVASKGATVGTLSTADSSIYGYYSTPSSGGYDVMLVNSDPSNAYSLTTASLGLNSSSEKEYVYDDADPAVVQSTLSGSTVAVPAESIVVLTGGSGSPSPSAPASAPPSASPTASASTSASASPSGSPSGGSGSGAGCSVSWSLTDSWSGAFQLGFTVTAGSSPITAWKVSYSWPGSQTVTDIWNASDAQTGAAVDASNLSYNGSLSAGGSTTFGLQASGTPPSSLTGLTCST